MENNKDILILAIESSCDETDGRSCLILFLPRSTCISCMAVSCRKSLPENTLRRLIR